jgi:hypothetical protein
MPRPPFLITYPELWGDCDTDKIQAAIYYHVDFTLVTISHSGRC